MFFLRSAVLSVSRVHFFFPEAVFGAFLPWRSYPILLDELDAWFCSFLFSLSVSASEAVAFGETDLYEIDLPNFLCRCKYDHLTRHFSLV